MDAGAVPELSAKGNRFWRMPLSGRVVDRKRCEHRPGLRTIAKSRDREHSLARSEFINPESFRGRLDLPNEPEDSAWPGVACAFGEFVLASSSGEADPPSSQLRLGRSPQRVDRIGIATITNHCGRGGRVGRGRRVGRGLGVTLGVAVGVTLGEGLVVGVGVAVGVAIGVGVTGGVAVGVGVGVAGSVVGGAAPG
jgi:hypothetical protein